MPELRLTKAEKAALVEKALREKARRQGANRKARADRIANGRRRIEKTVPALFLPEIRQLVAAVLAELEAGREPRLRRGDPVPPTEPSAQDVGDDPGPITAPPPGTRGLGPAARRRAQTARRRERQRAAGLSRTTFDVPATLVNALSELVDRMVAWMSEGVEVILDVKAVSTELISPGACVDAPCLASVIFDFQRGSSIGRVSGLAMWPSMTPRAGMLFGRLGSHRFRELQALEPRV